MPDKRRGDDERNARIVMTYFHPFTLHKTTDNDMIPHASNLRPENQSWMVSLRKWLDGEVLTYESRNYIQNFFCVAQMRPDFLPEANKNDEDLFSDEELDMEKVSLEELLRTHVGSTRDTVEEAVHNGDDEEAPCKKTHEAISKSDAYWKGRNMTETKEPQPKRQRRLHGDYSGEVLKELKKAVSRSQQGKEEDVFANASTDPCFSKKQKISMGELQQWFSSLTPDAQEKN